MRMESQIPIVGSALVGGLAQSWLVRKYPEWSWPLNLAVIAGGLYLGTRSGMMESIGVGLAASGASTLGVSLLPLEGTARAVPGGVIRRAFAGAPARGALAPATGSVWPAPRSADRFRTVRL